MGANSGKSQNARNVGTMRLYFDKGEYIPGEIVIGSVQLTLSHPIHCDTITIRFKGSEQMVYKGETDAPHQTFDRIVHVINVNKILNAGPTQFQFEYQLPSSLQPSYFISKFGQRSQIREQAESQLVVKEEVDHDEVRFSLVYMMLAQLEVNDPNIFDLQALNIMRIGESPNSLPINESFTTRLRNFFGDLGLYNQIVRIEKNEFTPGETIRISMIVENVGKLALRDIELELVREQIIFGQAGKKNSKQKMLSINKKSFPISFPGQSSNNKADVTFTLPLNTKVLFASFTGGTFSCRYFLSFSFVFANSCFGTQRITKNIPITILGN